MSRTPEPDPQSQSFSQSYVCVCVLDIAIWDDFLCVFATGMRSGQEDDEEVFSETCENSIVSLFLGSSSCHNVRSSRPCVGRFPLGLDDLTLWHDELPNCRETLLLSHVPLNKSWRDGQE